MNPYLSSLDLKDSRLKRKSRIIIESKVAKDTIKYRHGNYPNYYSIRKNDTRLDLIPNKFFKGKRVLDIGCNSGNITIEIARKFEPEFIKGIDIDKSLISKASKNLIMKSKTCSKEVSDDPACFPQNIVFECFDFLLLPVKERCSVILALSITKWIHLNHGDSGIKQFFKKCHSILQVNGILILEAQSFETYTKRSKSCREMAVNQAKMKLLPDMFEEYLINDVGFRNSEHLGIPEEQQVKGFQRPVIVFRK